MSLFTKIFGDPNEKVIRTLQPTVERINALEAEYSKMTPPQVREASLALRDAVRVGRKSLDDILPEAFALCREAAKRTLGQRHFDVQLLGGIVLHRGQIAEMRTGEGKTLTATLAVYLNGLSGLGVHVVTVNDYLARRDCAWMGQIYDFLGLTVGCINHQIAYQYDAAWKAPPKPELDAADLAAASAKEQGGTKDQKRDETGSFLIQADFLKPVMRQDSYRCDITYGTNNEFGFDYLRDNMVMRPEDCAQRPLNYAIIDEVDSILVDEARTPLIISAPAEEAAETYYRFADLVQKLQKDVDYNVDEKMHAVALNEVGIAKIEQMLNVANVYEAGGVGTVHHIDCALNAKELYKLDVNYVVKEGEVIIVDEFTGRLMHGRRYSEGIHQAIEAKERVEIQRESQTLATITFQNLFRIYRKLAGMTGTAATEAEEFSKIYNLDVVVVPPNRPSRRDDQSDRVYKNEHGKFLAVVERIKECHEKGQPVLVGTISIEKNEVLGELLRREGIPYELLNAKNHEREAQIIAQAGRAGAVTVATNMAGRGVDIILGGNPPDAVAGEKVCAAGGLLVLGTERHESRRIDNQLRGRSGRQGDPGATQFYVSMEDDLMRIFGSERMQGLMEKMGLPDDMPLEAKMITSSIAAAQRKVEGHHFDIRKHLLEYDDVLNKHREAIYKKRREMLEWDAAGADAAKVREHVLGLVEQEIEQVVMFHTAAEDEKTWNLREVYEVTHTIFPVPPAVRIELGELRTKAGSRVEDAATRTRIIEHLFELANRAYDSLEGDVNQALAGQGKFSQIVKNLILRANDHLWVEHLDAMEHLRTGIGLQSYGQRDPLIEYKRQAYRMFHELVSAISKQIVYSVFKIGIARPETRTASLLDRRGVNLSAPPKSAGEGSAAASAPVGAGSAAAKVGRNDPCPCGAKKSDGTPIKYKHCHGK